MFFYFLCALLLLNVFTTEAQVKGECKDRAVGTRAGPRFCEYMATSKTPDGDILCKAEGYTEYAKEYCAKSCNLCK